jgi:hypothetical protein
MGAALIVLGVLIPALVGGDLLRRGLRGTFPMTLPGSRTLHLSEGVYVGVRAPGAKTSLPTYFNLTVQESLTGQEVPVQTAPLSTTGGTTQPLFQFQILDSGDYLVSGVTSPGPMEKAPTLDVVILHESLASSRSDLAVGVFAFFILSAGGVFLIVVTRRKFRALKTPK